MRFTLSATVVLLAGFVLAQTPPPAGLPMQNDKLDQVLASWERAMADLNTMVAYCTRTTVDKVFQSTETFKGAAKFVKAERPGLGSRASLELYKYKGKDAQQKESYDLEVFEKFVCADNKLYEFAPQTKVVRVHELPPPRDGQLAEDNFLSFLFGMRAVEAKRRYKLTYVPANDKWYHYIRVEPLYPSDRADFTEARLVLWQKDCMPAQLWFQQPNQNEVTWNFDRIDSNVKVDPRAFEVRKLSGWQFQDMPRQPTAPRVIRQNQ